MTYRKSGVTSRLEWTHQSRSIVEIVESGSARHEGTTFVVEASRPGEDVRAPVAAEALEAFATSVKQLVPQPARIERLVVAAGRASHSVGGREWSDANARCFVSLAGPDTSLQVELDLGAAALEQIDLAPLQRAADAITRFRGDIPLRGGLRLDPIVSAALWRALPTTTAPPSRVRLFQSTHAEFRFDGNGNPIEEHLGPDWPNVYRPSYRGAPVVTPFHLDIDAAQGEGSGELTAVALLEPFRIASGQLVMTALCLQDDAAFRLTISLAPEEWLRRIRDVSGDRAWFPFGAGSWGRRLTIASR